MSHFNTLFSTMTDDALVSTLRNVTSTMLDIEQGKLKLPTDRIAKVVANATAMADEVERRGITDMLRVNSKTTLGRRLQKRGIVA